MRCQFHEALLIIQYWIQQNYWTLLLKDINIITFILHLKSISFFYSHCLNLIGSSFIFYENGSIDIKTKKDLYHNHEHVVFQPQSQQISQLLIIKYIDFHFVNNFNICPYFDRLGSQKNKMLEQTALLPIQTPHQSHQSKRVSFQTQQSMLSGSTRKKYFLKNKKVPQQLILTLSPSKSNIFDLTANINSTYSEIATSHHSQSRLYTNSLFSSPSKDTLIDNPQKKIVLPIITESKYNFKPTLALPKVKKSQYHQKAPLYVQNAIVAQRRNIKRMKKYHMIWAHSTQLRQDKGLLDRSTEKADKYIKNHNADFKNKKSSIQFETILRDRHIKEENRIGFCKGVPNRSLPGLKGKGGSVRSLFEEMYAVEQVYKIDK